MLAALVVTFIIGMVAGAATIYVWASLRAGKLADTCANGYDTAPYSFRVGYKRAFRDLFRDEAIG